jgi:hypothetical protein
MDISAWKSAIQRSEALLTQEERIRYVNAQPHDIVLDFKNSRKVKAQTNKFKKALSRIQSFVFLDWAILNIAWRSHKCSAWYSLAKMGNDESASYGLYPFRELIPNTN